MTEFRDKILAAQGRVEFLFDPRSGGIATQVSGTGFMALYCVAVSMDGRHLLSTVSPPGLGETITCPRPSVITYIQSDTQGMWGRNCPFCKKYFRTTHIFGITFCPYCATGTDSLRFISKDQRKYIIAFYDAFARAYLGKTNTSLDFAEITDTRPAWHYSEEKQQFHFSCSTTGCNTATDILGEFGYCPRCGRTNARCLFLNRMDDMLTRLEHVKKTIENRREREKVWEEMTKAAVSELEALARHLRRKLLCFPMTSNRRRSLEELNFQKPLEADALLMQWFDIGLLEWRGNAKSPGRKVAQAELPFIKKMLQKRHILMHNGGIVDQAYLDLSGDNQSRLEQRVEVRSHEARHFIEVVRAVAENFLDNVEDGFEERTHDL